MIFVSLLLAVIALILRVTGGRPVLFRQEPAGLGSEIFTRYNYRSMRTTPHDKQGNPIADAERISKQGHFLH